eukprot:GHVU01152688.1.p2 GENE.GHVU01152688.1~~GHVU01152688.1.p2  ORF type:complete len:104 (+),score=13.40 GHVU01152688.1:1161-1472(+)
MRVRIQACMHTHMLHGHGYVYPHLFVMYAHQSCIRQLFFDEPTNMMKIVAPNEPLIVMDCGLVKCVCTVSQQAANFEFLPPPGSDLFETRYMTTAVTPEDYRR